jgi:hypothetical protein
VKSGADRLFRVLAAGALLAVPSAQAVVLTPGFSELLPTGTTLAARPELAGQVLEDVVAPFSFVYGTGTMTGTVQSRVVRETVSGTLDFYWRITNDAGSPLGMPSFQLNDFFTSSYDADWRADGLGSKAPDFAHLASSLFGGPLYYEFQFHPIAPGEQSYFMLLHTDATHYAKTATYVVNPVQPIFEEPDPNDFYLTFAPAVPEPSTYALLVTGLLLTAGVAARRRG